MKKTLLLSIALMGFAACEPIEPINAVGRVMVWSIETGGTVTDTIAPTTIFNYTRDIENSYYNLELPTLDDAVLDTTWTYFF